MSEKAAAKRRVGMAEDAFANQPKNPPKANATNVPFSSAEQKQKTKRKLVFEEVGKSKSRRLQDASITKPVKAAGQGILSKAHSKVSEVEHENVGVEAGHKAERLTEGGLRAASRHRKLAPARRADKLGKKASKLNAKAAYQRALSDNPKLKKGPLSRMAQRLKIRRQYAKKLRQAQKAAQRAKQAGSAMGAIGGFMIRHPVLTVVVLLAALLIALIVSLFGAFGSMASSAGGAVAATSYLAADADIDAAELAYTEWESDLQMEVRNAEQTHQGFDEYRYSVPDIGHGPHELMAYLTAVHNEFTFAGVEADLRSIFAEQYQLSFTEEVEIRTRTVWVLEPVSGTYIETTEEYEWRILNVRLTARSFTDVIAPRMDVGQTQRYALLTQIKGNRQYVGSPFSFNWLPYVSDGYGWRVHPISGAKDNHRAVDIALATGTEILAAHDGTVTTAGWNDSYGNYIVLTGENGVETKYAHCSELLVAQGQSVAMGDVIAKVGSTGDSTGSHLHFEVLKDGMYLNPLYFSITNDDGSSAIPPGTPGGASLPENPGAPMDSGRFAAMLEVAQAQLGKPYIFGTAGPDTFDCSGFVSFVLANSIYPRFSHTTAQGLYNLCTPISRADLQPGDLVLFTGTYNAGRPVTHCGIYVGNGQMIHAGDPVQYASIDAAYWQEHLYAYGRLP